MNQFQVEIAYNLLFYLVMAGAINYFFELRKRQLYTSVAVNVFLFIMMLFSVFMTTTYFKPYLKQQPVQITTSTVIYVGLILITSTAFFNYMLSI